MSGRAGEARPVTNLLASRTYCFYVRQSCASSPNPGFAGPSCFQTLSVAGGAVGDEPCGAQPLVLTSAGTPMQTVSGSTVAATTSTQPGIGAPTCAPTTTPQDVWFTMTPAAGTSAVSLALTGSAPGMVRVFTAPDCAAGLFTLVACRSSGANNTGLRTVILPNLTAGQRYYVAVSGYGAADTPGPFTIAGNTVTSARLQAETNALQVYPNPSATGQLTLRLSGLRAAGQATLLNALGQVVRTLAVPGGVSEQTLKTSGLATGLYTLRVVVGQDVLTRKVVLE